MNEQKTIVQMSSWRSLSYSLVIMVALLGGTEVILRVWAN